MTQLYTMGYSGLSPAKVKKIVDNLGAVLVDIRLVARSRIPHWNKSRLEELFAGDYMHVPSLGNLNYKRGGSIAIANFALGKQSLEIIASSLHKPMVLMCACHNAETCHRTMVAAMLRADGFAVEELTPQRMANLMAADTPTPQVAPKERPTQLGLFD
jgi:uncharacterized protein (DUF488 family)